MLHCMQDDSPCYWLRLHLWDATIHALRSSIAQMTHDRHHRSASNTHNCWIMLNMSVTSTPELSSRTKSSSSSKSSIIAKQMKPSTVSTHKKLRVNKSASYCWEVAAFSLSPNHTMLTHWSQQRNQMSQLTSSFSSPEAWGQMITSGKLARCSGREDLVAIRDVLKPSVSQTSLGKTSSDDTSSYWIQSFNKHNIQAFRQHVLTSQEQKLELEMPITTLQNEVYLSVASHLKWRPQ